MDIETYKYNIDGFNATSLIAQLGCPLSLYICSGRNSPFLRKIRQRSSESVLSEIEFLHKEYASRGFMFYDDELNVNKNMVQLMDMIQTIKKKIVLSFD